MGREICYNVVPVNGINLILRQVLHFCL